MTFVVYHLLPKPDVLEQNGLQIRNQQPQISYENMILVKKKF